MDLSHWYKKDVVLDWQSQRLSFAVSQSLFSSHDVDVGSRLLLRSLDLAAVPMYGRAIDFGCGYGVLGLALKQVRPEWTVELIDRDALAVAFSKWNAERLGWDEASGVRCRAGIGVESAPPEGVDLLLWNVPGKAGQQVLEQLTRDAIDALAGSGLLALVVVNPLAATLRSVITSEHAVSIERDSAFASHTVILVRRPTHLQHRSRETRSPFARGVFDRAARTFEWGDRAYTITPVVGLPDYDSRSHATERALDLIDALDGRIDDVVVHGVGQGHVPVLLNSTVGARAMILIDRDVLALAATRRALAEAGVAQDHVIVHARPDIGQIWETAGSVLLVVMLPDQQEPEVTAHQIRDITAMADPGIDLLIAGSSTSVTRFLAVVKRQPGWRVKTRRKRHGASAAVLSVTCPSR